MARDPLTGYSPSSTSLKIHNLLLTAIFYIKYYANKYILDKVLYIFKQNQKLYFCLLYAGKIYVFHLQTLQA